MDEFLNTTINGLSSGAIYALGAIGLSLVYGILKLVNFAHGDFITLGGFVAFAINVSAGMPLAVAFLGAIAAVAALGLVLEFTIWAPMRRRGAGRHAAAAAVDRAGVRHPQPDPVRVGRQPTAALDVDHFQSWNLVRRTSRSRPSRSR